MSIYATKWAYAQPVKPAGRKFILVAIADFADAEGRAYPGVNTIADMTGQDERSVRRHMDALEAGGYIKCMERRRRDGSRTTDEVWLQAPEEALRPPTATTGQNARKSTGQNARKPQQPDNLTEPTGQFDGAKRTICPTSPDNLTGRTEPSVNHHQEPSLSFAADAAAGAPKFQAGDADAQHLALTLTPGQDESLATADPAADTCSEKVPPAARAASAETGAAPRRLSDAARIIAAWNDHRAALPEVQGLNEGRKKAIKKLIRDCDGDIDHAVALVADATCEVAQDDYWRTHRYGFDNLVPGKVFGRAEAWRSRQHASPNRTLDPTGGAPAAANGDPDAGKDWLA